MSSVERARQFGPPSRPSRSTEFEPFQARPFFRPHVEACTYTPGEDGQSATLEIDTTSDLPSGEHEIEIGFLCLGEDENVQGSFTITAVKE